jgi:sugar phosphate isomerase/epimerase
VEPVESAAELPLAPTLGPLVNSQTPPRATFQRLARAGFRHVQLSATLAGMRPRELDRSARRDLLATLRRAELTVSGVDFWIPISDFDDPARMDRAIAATQAAVELAADLGRQALSLILPGNDEVVETLAVHASHHGVPLADHARPPSPHVAVGVGIDPAAVLSQNVDPATEVMQAGPRLTVARLSNLSITGMRLPIGERGDGRLDAMAYRVALSVVGYRRPVIVDARQWTDPWSGIEQTQSAWRLAAPR